MTMQSENRLSSEELHEQFAVPATDLLQGRFTALPPFYLLLVDDEQKVLRTVSFYMSAHIANCLFGDFLPSK